MPTWFLILNGVALLVMGGALLLGRIRQEGSFASPAKFFGALWALTCLLVGLGLLAMAAGYVPRPGAAREVQGPYRPEFPEGR